MRVELPDINILIALLDTHHRRHNDSKAWFSVAGRAKWATCAFTQNGCVRIVSNPSYPGLNYNVAQAADALEALISQCGDTHEFWSETVSIFDKTVFDRGRIAGPKQIADVYLLGLCQHMGGTFVTLDEKITTAAIVAPHPQLLRVL